MTFSWQLNVANDGIVVRRFANCDYRGLDGCLNSHKNVIKSCIRILPFAWDCDPSLKRQVFKARAKARALEDGQGLLTCELKLVMRRIEVPSHNHAFKFV